MSGRVIFVNRYFFPDHSATSQLLTDLALSLASHGKDVHVLTGRQLYDEPNAALPTQERHQGVDIHRIWTTRFGRGRLLGRLCDYVTFYFSTLIVMLRMARKGDVIVSKTDPPLISVVGYIVGRLTGAVQINWVQDLFPEVGTAVGVRGMSLIEGLLRRTRNLSLQAAYTNVVLGQRMAERLAQEGIAANHISIIHNWADGDAIYPVPHEQNTTRMDWGLSGYFIIGYSGNMGRVHEFQTILHAAERVTHHASLRFLFVGGGAQLRWLKEEVARRNLRNVLFQPYQPRHLLRLTLGVPDIHLVSLNPRLEGLVVPSKFYGIAAAGRGVINIGDPSGEIAKLIREGNCGYTVAPEAAHSLVTLIERLATDPTEVSRLGNRARALFELKYNRSEAYRKWEMTLNKGLSLAA